MEPTKLLYFQGCPNAEKLRTNLKDVGVTFEEVVQDLLPEEHPFRSYSSPSVLHNNEIIFGIAVSGSGGGCTVGAPSPEKLRALMPVRKQDSKLAGGGQVLTQTGSWGSILTVILCPVCKPALAVFLSSIGVGFLADEMVLKPLLVAFLLVTVGGLLWSYLKQHGNMIPLIFGLFFSVSLYLGRYVYFGANLNTVLTYGSLAGLVTIGIWNLVLHRQWKTTRQCQGACGRNLV